jgi:hypothetical protein
MVRVGVNCEVDLEEAPWLPQELALQTPTRTEG